MKNIPVNVSSFRELKEHGYYFVDKTRMIEELLHNGGFVDMLIRPSGFGKSVNLSMLVEFFDITKNSEDLFKDTYIAGTDCYGEMNKWPVIYLSFQDVKGSKEEIIGAVRKEILREYRRYDDVVKKLDQYNYINRTIRALESDELDDPTWVAISFSLMKLTEILAEYYGRNTIVLIDDYDVPHIACENSNCFDELGNLLDSILESSLKGNNSLHKAFLMGTHRAAAPRSRGGLNNVVVDTILINSFDTCFGFTEKETKDFLESYGLVCTDQLREMYGGYHINDNLYYRPDSIVKYMENRKFCVYGIEESHRELVKDRLRHALYQNKYSESYEHHVQELMDHKHILNRPDLRDDYFENTDDYKLKTVLVNEGYLAVKERVGFKSQMVALVNQEMYEDFSKILKELKEEQAKNQ